MEKPPTSATGLHEPWIADLDLESLPERLDDRQLAMVKRIAASPLPSLPPCSEIELVKCLRIMRAVLPRQISDDLSGELFVEAYARQLGEYPAAAIGYLADQATRQCRWFPTIAECLEILSGWRRWDADTMRRSDATRLANREQAARNPTPPRAPPGEQWHPSQEEIDEIKRRATGNLRAK